MKILRTLLAIIQTRLELVGVELAQEKERLLRLATLAFLTAFFGAVGVMLASLVIVIFFWDSYRWEALSAVALGYLFIAAWLYVKLQTCLRAHPPLFEATLAALDKDRTVLFGEGDPS